MVVVCILLIQNSNTIEILKSISINVQPMRHRSSQKAGQLPKIVFLLHFFSFFFSFISTSMSHENVLPLETNANVTGLFAHGHSSFLQRPGQFVAISMCLLHLY